MEGAKNMLKKFAKQALKKFLFSKVGLIAIAIVIVFIMVLAGGMYLLNILEGVLKEGDLKNVPYGASTYTNSVTISSNGLTTEMTAQELWDTMIENGSNVKKYLKTPQELEKLMKAEIVTQNPKIGKGELDGIIEFKRRKTDKSVIDLKYVDEETFNSYIDAYNTDGDETALKYYTIDANGNALIAQWTKTTKTVEVSVDGSTPTSETTITYSMTSAMINYKSVVQKYSMPFDYLWALLITTNGKKFVLELADYVIEDSSIDITGIENYSSTPDVDGPKSETITVTEEVDVTDPKTGKKYKEKKTVNKTKTTTITTIVETNNVNADLTKADTWIMDYKKDEDGNVTSKPKVDKDSNERNFITILNKYPYTKQNLDSSALMLFEILERNTSTANMVDLTKYLLYVATGNYYGVKNIDDIKSLYENINFSDFSFYNTSDFMVDTSKDSSNLVIKDKNVLIKGIKSVFSGQKQTNLLSVVDELMEIQDKYHVNAVFAIAVAKEESQCGTAWAAIDPSTYNWMSLTGYYNGKTYKNPNSTNPRTWRVYSSFNEATIDFADNIANGDYYYKAQKFTLSQIAPVYGGASYETYMADIQQFYKAVGISMESINIDGNAPTQGSSSEKLKYLFPNGIPTSQSACESYLATVQIALTKKDGTKTAGNLRIHKSLASDVQKVFQLAQNSGFKVYEASGYSYRIMNNGGSGNLSHHSYGVAIDINVNENYSHRGSTIYAGSFWNPSISEYSIPRNGVLVKAFESIGWKWGGNWSGNYQDYMHFSYTGN